MEKKTVFFLCQCEADALAVERVDWDDAPAQYQVACWAFGAGYSKSSSLHERLKCIWHIIKEGHPFCDYVIFDRDTLDELIKHLQEIR